MAQRTSPAVSPGLPRWPLVISIGATFSIMLIALAIIVDQHRQVGRHALENSENLLRLIERDIGRNIEVLDLSLQAVVAGLAKPDVLALNPDLQRLVLFDHSVTATGLGAMVAFDGSGRIFLDAASKVPRVIDPVSDRDYFQAQREHDSGLFISRPYKSRLIGTDVIGLSRRVSNPDGRFAGVALASIQLSYFTDLLTKLKIGSGGVVSLVRTDGTILVRHAPGLLTRSDNIAGSEVFRRILAERTGSLSAVSAIDGVERMYTFTQVGSLPLMLTVALASSDIFADWWTRSVVIGLVLLTICGIIIGLTIVLTYQLHSRAKIERSLVEANEQLERLSSTDGLTQIGNRRRFDASINREIRRSARTGEALSLVLLDVDLFKSFNDRYGHQEGDRALKAVADVLGRCASRAGDSAYRVGGEEFALLLPNTPLSGALKVAEDIRRQVRALERPHAGNRDGIVTVSLGAAALAADDAAGLYARADAALYDAKRNGRDRAMPPPAEKLAA